MTTIRHVWAEGLSPEQLNGLRNEINEAIRDPNHIIVTNYEVHWNELEWSLEADKDSNAGL